MNVFSCIKSNNEFKFQYGHHFSIWRLIHYYILVFLTENLYVSKLPGDKVYLSTAMYLLHYCSTNINVVGLYYFIRVMS